MKIKVEMCMTTECLLIISSIVVDYWGITLFLDKRIHFVFHIIFLLISNFTSCIMLGRAPVFILTIYVHLMNDVII